MDGISISLQITQVQRRKVEVFFFLKNKIEQIINTQHKDKHKGIHERSGLYKCKFSRRTAACRKIHLSRLINADRSDTKRCVHFDLKFLKFKIEGLILTSSGTFSISHFADDAAQIIISLNEAKHGR